MVSAKPENSWFGLQRILGSSPDSNKYRHVQGRHRSEKYPVCLFDRFHRTLHGPEDLYKLFHKETAMLQLKTSHESSVLTNTDSDICQDHLFTLDNFILSSCFNFRNSLLFEIKQTSERGLFLKRSFSKYSTSTLNRSKL